MLIKETDGTASTEVRSVNVTEQVLVLKNDFSQEQTSTDFQQ